MRKLMLLLLLLLTLAGCGGGGSSVRQLPHLGNTPYQQDTILVTYATNPERALTLLDSALRLGNISDYRGQVIRAKIYSKSLMEQQQDSAILICEALLTHDSVRNAPAEQENLYDMLIAASRVKHDLEAYLHWATRKAELCQQQGAENERWRTEADIGYVMTRLGQVGEGLQKLDEAISRLDAPGSIDRMDAFIVAVKRKINALIDLGRYDEVITQGQRILDRLAHYEQHASDYAEDSYRLSWSDHPNDRDRYLDFSRAQAWGFMAQAYSLTPFPIPEQSSPTRSLSPKGEGSNYQKAKEYLALFNQSDYGKTFMARRMIAPAQMALGLYDEALTTYDEVERRMAGDTLNDDYAVILRSRAIAARAKGRMAEALDFQTRYAALSKAVSDSLHHSEAHDYAARYHAYEQQLEIQKKEAEAERSHIVSLAVAVIALLAIVFAVYFFYQKRIVNEKNRALVRMINGTLPELTDEPESVDEESEEPETDEPDDEPETDVRSDAELFTVIGTTIRSERLYADIGLQRQDICSRFHIHRHALNNLFTVYAGGKSVTQYINALRMEEAVSLLRDRPDLTITAIAATVGFSPANLRDQFKQQYGMTPGEYRKSI